MDERLRRAALEAIGFMPEHEGLALYELGWEAGRWPAVLFFLIAEPLGLARLWQIGKEKLRLWPFPH